MKKIITSFFIFFLFLAEPVLANVTPNDPDYSNQWYLAKIKADSAWNTISASPDIVIAVIDSGIDINHPDLKDNIWTNSQEVAGNGQDDDHNGFVDDIHGWDFVNNVPDPSPKFSPGWTEAGVSHGTIVAGIIAAEGNNEIGIAGVTWRAKIMALKALDDNGQGKVSDVVRAINYAVDNGADIINLSFVSFNYSQALQEAIARAHQAGVIVVAAAGNEQAAGNGYNIDKTPIYPACYDGDAGENMVIGVVATDALDQKARFSSYGSRCVDIAAPGISFFSTVTPGSDFNDPNKSYDGYWSGTSMATALVSGSLALIKEVNPELSQREIVNILFASADNIDRLNPDYLGKMGNGRLNVNKAINLALTSLYSRDGRLVVLPTTGSQDVKLTAANGDLVKTLPATNLASGSHLAAGDLNGDGQQELIVGAPQGAAPQIKILDENGKLLKQFLAFAKNFTGGVNVTVADLNRDDHEEIIATQAVAGNGQVKIFDTSGKLLKEFSADNGPWRLGLSVAAGDLNGDNQEEIVVAYGKTSAPLVKIFSAAGQLLNSFVPYEQSFRGGAQVAVADLHGRQNRGREQIIVAPGPGREPLLKIFDQSGNLQKQFLAYGRNWQGGFDLAVGDLNNDGIPEIATGAQPGAAPHVRVFSAQGTLLESFYAWDAGFPGGANIGIIQISN